MLLDLKKIRFNPYIENYCRNIALNQEKSRYLIKLARLQDILLRIELIRRKEIRNALNYLNLEMKGLI